MVCYSGGRTRPIISADSFYNVRMEYSYSIQPAKWTAVDIPATSRLLKELRNKNGYSVKHLQEIFGFDDSGSWQTCIHQ